MDTVLHPAEDFDNLRQFQPVVYLDPDTQRAYDARVDFVCFDYCVLRYVDPTGQALIALVVLIEEIQILVEAPQPPLEMHVKGIGVL